MPSTNTFFTATTGYSGEQRLIDSLVIEQIGIYGIDLMYMPRENINLDRLLHEATKDVFRLAMSIPMYIKSFDGYDNSIEVLSKFGVRSSDELTLVMSRSQWSTYYAPYVKSLYNAQSGRPVGAQDDPLDGQTSRRPKEGDLIYFPYDGGMFEVKYVQFDQPFFQLGKGYVFELQCEKFEYSGEDFMTGVPEIDSTSERSEFPMLQLNMLSGGISNFEFQEKVRIFNLSSIAFADLTTTSGDPILTDDLKFVKPDQTDVFQLYDDAGLIRQVPYVEGTVGRWNATKRELIIENMTDLDPEQINLVTGNVDINKFDTVLVVGQESGASWTSSSAQQERKAFDSAADIQEEFNRVKVYDTADTNPFGFY